MTVTLYAQMLGVGRKTATKLLKELADADALIECRFPQGHEGAIEVRCYADLVRVKTTRMDDVARVETALMDPAIRVESTRGSRQNDARQVPKRRERPGETPHQTSDAKTSDQVRRDPLVDQMANFCERFGVEPDEAKKGLAEIRITDNIADHLIDAAISKAEKQEAEKPGTVRNPIGYVRRIARSDLEFVTGRGRQAS